MPYTRQYPDPVFMFGALRSGTTLLRLMLTHHSKIHSPGEADCLFEHLSADPSAPGGWGCDRAALRDDWRFQVEMGDIALPDGPEGGDLIHALNDRIQAQAPGHVTAMTVHRGAPAMASLFPNAKIIHLLRDPRDTARSAVGMGWDGNSYHGVRHWLDAETGWDQVDIPADRVLTVRFEKLITDLEAGLTEICDFLGLDFDPGMLGYHKTSTYGPPDASAAWKWRARATAREISLIEGRVGARLQARGYPPSGRPARRPGALEKAWLKADSLLHRWRFNARRYGFGLFVSHHLARLLHLRPLADRLAARQFQIKLQNLK